ncbi:hypothetical protein C8F01DRAFT_31304 [Mycena amicta]|nr:hypothetical protein C8F01DRAFT_31304 [Mycena amicta]
MTASGWFRDTFDPQYARSEIGSALARSIVDVIAEISHILAPPVRAELTHAKELEKVKILFNYLDEQVGNADLVRAFQLAVASRGGVGYLLNGSLNHLLGEETGARVRSQQPARAHLAAEKEFEAGFQRLQHYINGDALHNSEQRFPPPKCHSETRVAVQEAIQSWAMSESEERPNVLWLYGPAGAGKSAIAQTMAERWSASGDLAAAFFFARWRNGGGNGAKLFPTLAYQFALRSPDLKRRIGRAMEEDPTTCHKTLEEQARILIRDRFLEVSCDYPTPRVVVIDGLDECDSNLKDAQTRIIKIIFQILLATGLPHRFLICSRPEPHIRETFDSLLASGRSYRHLVLDDTFDPDRDIRLYLTASFSRLRDRVSTPRHWPSQQNVDLLVQQASGQFIYAATVLKFVDDEYSDPQERLQLILHADPSSDEESASAFADLDMLYRMILSTNPNTALVTRILGAYFALPDTSVHRANAIRQGRVLRCISFLDGILGLPVGTVRRALRGLHSLFFIPSTDKMKMTPYHASLHDFLCSRSRSREFFLNSERHHEHVLERCLEIIFSDLNGSNRHCDPDSATYSSRHWHNHLVDTMTSAQLLVSFLGRLQDLLTPQEFSNYASMDTRIHGIIDFLCSLDALTIVYPGREHRRASYLTNARNKLANTLLLTVFDPTSDSRQFYDTGGSECFSEHSLVLWSCPKVIHIQSTLGAIMRALTNQVPPWLQLPQPQFSIEPRPFYFTMHRALLQEFLSSNNSNRNICVRAAKVSLELLLYRRATNTNMLLFTHSIEPQRLMTGSEHPMPVRIASLGATLLHSDINGRLQVSGVGG